MNQSDLILKAARDCISTKGYAQVSLRTIASEAGVALSQLHYYYGSKKDLFKAVILDLVTEYLDEFKKGVDHDKSLTTFINYARSILKEKPDLFKLMFDLSSLALWSKQFKGLLSNLLDEITCILEECIPDSANIVNYEKKSLAKALTGAVFGIALQYILDPTSNDDTLDAMDIIPELL